MSCRQAHALNCSALTPRQQDDLRALMMNGVPTVWEPTVFRTFQQEHLLHQTEKPHVNLTDPAKTTQNDPLPAGGYLDAPSEHMHKTLSELILK